MDIIYSGPRRFWRVLYPALIFVAIQFAVMFIVGIVFIALGLIGNISAETAVPISVLLDDALKYVARETWLLMLIISVVKLAVFAPMWWKSRNTKERYSNENPAAVYLIVVLFFAAFNIVQIVVFSITDVVRFFPTYDSISELFVSDNTIMRFAIIGFLAPITEELVFRGILINRMRGMPVWASIAIQAVLFSLVHLNLFQSLYAFVAGILLGYAYIKFRSLGVVILGHMTYNLSSLLMVEFATENEAIPVILMSIVLLPICAVLAVKQQKASTITAEPVTLPPPLNPWPDPWDR